MITSRRLKYGYVFFPLRKHAIQPHKISNGQPD
jgi:hypothetical protein